MSQQEIAAQVDALREELANLAKRFADYAERDVGPLTEAVSRGARQARRVIDRKVAQVADQTNEMADAARAQATDLQQAVEDYVVDNPLRAVAIAAGVGLLIGAMSRR